MFHFCTQKVHFNLQVLHENSFHSFLVFSFFSSFLSCIFHLLLYYFDRDSKARCQNVARNNCVLSQHIQCSQTAHHLPWMGLSALASSPCDLPYPVTVHCFKGKSSYITLNISASVPLFLLSQANSDRTAVKALQCKEHSARLDVCSCYCIVI